MTDQVPTLRPANLASDPADPPPPTTSEEAADWASPPWPWWMAPARLVGRFRPALVAAAGGDRNAIHRLPWILRLLLPLVVIALAAVIAGMHAAGATAYNPQDVDWLRLQIDTTFTEVPLVLIVLCVLGAWSPSAGVLFVLAYGVLDLGAATLDHYEMSPLLTALAGRLVALWLLWLLVVEIPIAGRSLALSLRGPAPNRLLVAVVAAAVTGFLTWVWTMVTPVLIRPVYLWSSIADIERSAIMPLQLAGVVFAFAAGVAAAVRAWLAWPGELLDGVAADAVPPRPLRSRGVQITRRLVIAALLTIALGGLVTTPLDAVVLFVALAGAGPLALLIATRTPVGAALRRLPVLARAALAVAASYGIALLVVMGGIVPTWHGPSEFFSVIASIAVGLFLVQLLTARPGPGVGPVNPGPIVAGATMALLLLGLSILAPAVALADNCASFADCWGAPIFGALVAAGLPVLLVLNFGDWLHDWNQRLGPPERRVNLGLSITPMAAHPVPPNHGPKKDKYGRPWPR